jgi:hypothetical protein
MAQKVWRRTAKRQFFPLSPGTEETFRSGLAGRNPGSNYSGDFNPHGERARLIGSTGKIKYMP